MTKFLTLFTALVLMISGCATAQKDNTKNPPIESTQSSKEISSASHLVNINEQDLQETAQSAGFVFGKTDFQGVLEKNFVRLLVVDQNNPEKEFVLHIGESSEELKFPWEGKAVKPGYFFLKLPPGKYKISSISIPVGSTMATEESHLSFEVSAGKIYYIGTLRIVGTKEKIRLGGVPVIKPGFEYTAGVINEEEAAIASFKERFPSAPDSIETHLLQLQSVKQVTE